jgi:outer membrane protein assembly factor BamB
MRQPLRLWPGVAAAALLLVTLFVVPLVLPAEAGIGFIAGYVSAVLIVVWWLAFSRARWFERVGALVSMVLAVALTRPLIDKSIAGGAMGNLQYALALPVMCLALVAWAFGTRRHSVPIRLASLPTAMLLACGFLTLLRTDGIGGETMFQLRWRWTQTAEERLLAEATDVPIAPIAPAVPSAVPSTAEISSEPPAAKSEDDSTAPAPAGAVPIRAAEWPGFRGPERNGVVRGVRINTDWAGSPPVELWRRPIGPGWSSFAVDGDRIYTQEQRGNDEIVACYSLATGKPVWMHKDSTRFWESNAGPGPRGTPALVNGRVYALGATGILNALDARTGAVIWSRNAASDTKVEVPMWGFSSSPLVTGDLVIVATAGTLAAYDLASGASRWVGPKHEFSYSSPHLVTIGDVAQVLLLSPPGVVSVTPSDGTLLWEHAFEGGAIVQPTMTPDGDVLISGLAGTGGSGVRRLGVARGSEGWTVQERWTSNGLKPYFNDFVIHKGFAYGFDGSIMSCIDLEDGKRKWKGGRYGNGQVVLLPDQDLLLVMTEEGELALVAAAADKFAEVARVPVLHSKTWNHPVIVGDLLLVRNGEEMAAFRLSPADHTSSRNARTGSIATAR